jgi:predicted AAA+ superfamily ATPase
MDLIKRVQYLSWLEDWRDKQVIKAITGIRRCGKSTLLSMFATQLHNSGVPADRILQLNLEDLKLGEVSRDHLSFYSYVTDRLQPDAMNYVFIDEVQQIPLFERLLDGLFILPNVDLYVTGSNSDLLGGSLATLLTGRYVELSILPLSFSEYASIPRTDRLSRPLSSDALLSRYQLEGGFPFVAQLENAEQRRQYLSGVADTVLLRDVVERLNIANTGALRSVTEFVMDSIGSLVSPKSIADTMTSKGRKIASATVDSYLTGLADAFVVYPAKRYDVKGKVMLERLEKQYAVDTGLRAALTGRTGDSGRQLENVIYLELLRRGWQVRVGKVGSKEIDFVAQLGDRSEYIQVAETARDPKTLERELYPLQHASGFSRRLLITTDNANYVTDDGIELVNAVDWLSDPQD